MRHPSSPSCQHLPSTLLAGMGSTSLPDVSLGFLICAPAPPYENQSDATLTKGGEQPHPAEQQLRWDLCGVHGSLGGNLYPHQMSPQAQSQALGQENMRNTGLCCTHWVMGTALQGCSELNGNRSGLHHLYF